MGTSEQPALKSVRGATRGTVLRGIVMDRIQRCGYVTMEDAMADFNSRYVAPLKEHNARLVFSQLVARGSLRKAAVGVYVPDAPVNGPILELVKAVDEVAWHVWEALKDFYVRGRSPKVDEIQAKVYALFKKQYPQPRIRKALVFLEEQKIVAWNGGTARACFLAWGRSPLLGGGKATDIVMPKRMAPVNDDRHNDYINSFRQRRTAEDDVIDPENPEPDDPPAIDPFS